MTKTIVVVKIEKSLNRPHAIVSKTDGKLEFWSRSNSAAITVSYTELKSMFERHIRSDGALTNLSSNFIYFCDQLGLQKNVLIFSSDGRRVHPTILPKIDYTLITESLDTGSELRKLLLLLNTQIESANIYKQYRIFHHGLTSSDGDIANEEYRKYLENNLDNLVQIIRSKL